MSWNKTVSLGLLTLLVCSMAANAEEQSAVPQYLEVRTTQVHPGKAAQYERLIGMVRQAQREAEWDGASFTHRVRLGPQGTYYTATQRNSLADLAPGNLFTGDDLAEFNALLAEAIKSSSVALYTTRTDLGRAPAQPADTPPDFYTTILARVDVASQPAYEEAVQKLVEAADKAAPDQYWFASGPGTATGPVYRFVIPGRWATADVGPTVPQMFIEAFGEEEGMRWLQQLGSATVETTTTMSINLPQLSYLGDGN